MESRRIITLSLVYLFFTTINLSSYAQKNSNNFVIGGIIGSNFSNSSGSTGIINTVDRYTDLHIAVLGGYNILDKLVLGLSINNNFERARYIDDLYNSISQNDLIVSPFIRYYPTIGFFLQVQGNLGSSKVSFKANEEYSNPVVPGFRAYDQIVKNSVSGFGGGIGYDFYITERFIFEPVLIYLYNNYKNKEDESSGKESGINANLGFVFRL